MNLSRNAPDTDVSDVADTVGKQEVQSLSLDVTYSVVRFLPPAGTCVMDIADVPSVIYTGIILTSMTL